MQALKATAVGELVRGVRGMALANPARILPARPQLLRPLLLQELRDAAIRPVVMHAAQPASSERLVQASGQDEEPEMTEFQLQRQQRKEQRQKEAVTYQFSAIAATVFVLTIAIVATYVRFSWHLQDDEFPWDEMVATLALVAGGTFGMEMYARVAHKSLWHDFQPGWALHKSHHEPRTGPFEANDIYAVANAVPAMALCAYGFFTPNVTGGLCFGAGLGITLFGIMYMFIHDGLVHKRFPVGPIAELPYMKRIVAAHQIHHMDKFAGVPFGMFLGPQELEGVPGGREELDRLVAEMEAREAAAKVAA